MPEKKKILLIDNSLYTTGSIHSTLQTTVQLKDRYEFIYILPAKSKIFQLVEDHGFEVLGLPMLEISRSYKVLLYLPMLLLNTFRLLRIIRKKQIDVIHVNDIYNMLGVSVKLFGPRLKVVYYVRLLKTSYIREMYPVFAELIGWFADHIICVSAAVQRDIGNPKQSQVVYTTFVNERLPAWDGLRDPGKIDILYLGNYMQGKGQQWAVYALAKVLRDYPHTHLTFAGGSNNSAHEGFKNWLKSLADELDIDSSISFNDPTDKVEKEMKNSDVILNLSESESFSMVCLEAISYGVPLVASDCGGPAEITDNGRQALLVANKDAEAAAEALISIIKDPETARRRAADAKVFARGKFNPGQAKSILENIYG
jgi:glycosyltransferase involved in cell wall biosynthesis